MDEGVDAPQILHDVFGDAIEGQRTFVQLAELYKARPRPADTDPETVKKENLRIKKICAAPWATELVAKISAAAGQKWLDERFAESSPATANRDRAKASAVFTNNDSIVNGAIVLSGVLVMWLGSNVPDLVLGLIVAGIAANGGREILREASESAERGASK